MWEITECEFLLTSTDTINRNTVVEMKDILKYFYGINAVDEVELVIERRKRVRSYSLKLLN